MEPCPIAELVAHLVATLTDIDAIRTAETTHRAGEARFNRLALDDDQGHYVSDDDFAWAGAWLAVENDPEAFDTTDAEQDARDLANQIVGRLETVS